MSDRYALSIIAARLAQGPDAESIERLTDQIEGILEDPPDNTDDREVLGFAFECLLGHSSMSRRQQRSLATAIARYLRDPELKPGPEHLPEDVSPRYSGSTGLDYCTPAAAGREVAA